MSFIDSQRKLRKLWQETRDPASKRIVNQGTQNVRRMIRKQHLKDGKKQSPQTAKSHLKQYGLLQNSSKRGGRPKAPLQFIVP
jgi:hypothetical protein